MTTTSPTVPDSTPDHSTDRLDPKGEQYRSTLRYLAATARDGSVRDIPDSVPTGPEYVRDVMVTGVVAAHEEAVFKEIVAALARNRISAVPVVDELRRVVGVVSESDLLARVSGGPVTLPRGHRFTGHAETRTKLHAATARELMTAPAVVTRPETHIAEAARLAAETRVRRLPVVDEYGVLIGIVTRADLLRPFLRPDSDIREDIERNIVLGSFLLNPHTVDVDVTEGVVSLRGELERKYVVDAFVDSVRAVSGVVDVDATGLRYTVDDALVPPPAPTMY
jgi:CBS domain-containing protein